MFLRKLYHHTIGKFVYHLKLYIYWSKISRKIGKIRNKKSITVLFVNSTLTSWKTELLYNAMNNHPRFQPIIGVSTNSCYEWAKPELISYLNKRNYNYVDLDSSLCSIRNIAPDIIFYSSPYEEDYSKGHFFKDNLDYIFCGVDYCLNITKHVAHNVHPWYDYCWQFYVEHADVAIRKRELLGYRARNILITGVPFVDSLLLPRDNFDDPWKDKTGKKRIIYAPHHSIKGTNGEGIEFSTFLEYGEYILELAKKYRDKITVAFKPHGILYGKLLKIWGEDRTNAYYHAWQDLSNTQFEKGDYLGLFKYSDAIIHDCASFILEYLYMDKPSMFLVSETNSFEEMYDYVRGGLDCYEKGQSKNDIDTFIKSLIDNKDNNKIQREDYIKAQLLPPGGRTACENIIDSILNY